MAVKTKDELISSIKSLIGDTPSDEGIALLEDISDTLDNSSGSSSDEDKKKIEELENKVKEIDESWRKKYIDRFETPSKVEPQDDTPSSEDTEPEEDNYPTHFDELFTTE